MADDWITTQEAVELTGYNPVYIRYLLSTGKIEGEKWARSWRISRQSLLDYRRKIEQAGAKRGPKTGT